MGEKQDAFIFVGIERTDDVARFQRSPVVCLECSLLFVNLRSEAFQLGYQIIATSLVGRRVRDAVTE